MVRLFTAASIATLLCAGSAAADDLTACLNTGPNAIAPIEAGKRALIDGRTDALFDELDPAGLFRGEVRRQIVGDLDGAVGTSPVLWCTLLQRVDYAPHHSSEVFVLRYAPDLFIYFVVYAIWQEQGWVTHSFAFNSDFSEIREHLR